MKNLILERIFQAWTTGLALTFIVAFVILITELLINGVPSTNGHFEF